MNKAFLLVLLLLASGCSKNTSSHQKLEMENKWHSMPDSKYISDTPTQENSQKKWWENFKDPQLNDLIKTAIDNNLDNKIAIERIKQARADRAVIKSGLFPTIDLSESASAAKRIGSGTGNARTDIFTTEFDMSWELDFFGKQRHLSNAGHYTTMSYESDQKLVLLTLVSDLVSEYIDYAKTLKLIEINSASLEEYKHSLDLTQSKHLSGITDSSDVESERAKLMDTKSKINDLNIQLKKSLYRIAILCGKQPGQLLLDNNKVSIPNMENKIFLDTPLDVLRKRPDVKKAEYQLLSSTSATRSAIASQYPQISISATIGHQNSNTTSPSASWNIAQSLIQPFINFGQIRATIKSQTAQEEQSFLSYQKVILSAIEEVESSLMSYENAQSNYSNALKSHKSRSHVLEMTKSLYESKVNSYHDIISAKKETLKAETTLVEKLADISKSTVKLYKALGYTIE